MDAHRGGTVVLVGRGSAMGNVSVLDLTCL
jgi:hypothetical protein